MQSSAQFCPTISDIPGRCDAEMALAATPGGGRQSFGYAAIYAVPGALTLIEDSDWKGADEALLAAFVDLSGRIGPSDRVFRWSGASLLVVTECGQPPAPGSASIQLQLNGPVTERMVREMDLSAAASLLQVRASNAA